MESRASMRLGQRSTMAVTLKNHSGIHNSTSCLNYAPWCRAGGIGLTESVVWESASGEPLWARCPKC